MPHVYSTYNPAFYSSTQVSIARTCLHCQTIQAVDAVAIEIAAAYEERGSTAVPHTTIWINLPCGWRIAVHGQCSADSAYQLSRALECLAIRCDRSDWLEFAGRCRTSTMGHEADNVFQPRSSGLRVLDSQRMTLCGVDGTVNSVCLTKSSAFLVPPGTLPTMHSGGGEKLANCTRHDQRSYRSLTCRYQSSGDCQWRWDRLSLQWT